MAKFAPEARTHRRVDSYDLTLMIEERAAGTTGGGSGLPSLLFEHVRRMVTDAPARIAAATIAASVSIASFAPA